MRLLITGASGYLGSALMYCLDKNHDVIGTYGRVPYPNLVSLDITKRENVLSLINEIRPNAIIHCVGLSRKFDTNPDYGRVVNIEGTKNVILGAQKNGASVIYISSAAVFNGREGFFTEKDEPSTTSEYGQSKIEAEELVKSSGLSHCIVRPSLIVGNAPYGMDEKDFGKITQSLQYSIPMELDNIWRFAPSWTAHIAQVIDWWLSHQDAVDLLHLTASGITTKLEFAHRLCTQLGVSTSLFTEKKNCLDSGNNILDSSLLRSVGAPVLTIEEIIAEIALEVQHLH